MYLFEEALVYSHIDIATQQAHGTLQEGLREGHVDLFEEELVYRHSDSATQQAHDAQQAHFLPGELIAMQQHCTDSRLPHLMHHVVGQLHRHADHFSNSGQ